MEYPGSFHGSSCVLCMEGFESWCYVFKCGAQTAGSGAQTAESVWHRLWSIVHPLRFINLDKV